MKPEIIELITPILQYFDVSESQLLSKSRKLEFVKARHLSIYVIKKHFDLSLKAIADEMGRTAKERHTSMLHSIRTAQDLMDCDYKLRDLIETIHPKRPVIVELSNKKVYYNHINFC